ncbi:F-box protein [Symbiodinium microadriaticum]|uniref:F-box protein n=2 Tax=Symbiodinium TaxID=2949 RepID=A0A1Q9DA43_SYMMI|nr:F-box protein [Symbiodinium microadriaticum]CAE7905134.1 unnamed protein product [Symbiodinium microadriaticum]
MLADGASLLLLLQAGVESSPDETRCEERESRCRWLLGFPSQSPEKETCYRSGVLQQLNTWAQYPHHAQLLFVEQLALECLSDWIWQIRAWSVMASPLFDGVSQIRAEAGALVLMKLEGKAGLWDADFRLKPGCSTPLFNWPCAVLESSTSSMSSSTSESSTKRDWRAGWADCHFDGRCHFEGRCRFDFDSSDSSPPLHENAKNLHDTLCDENLEEGLQAASFSAGNFMGACQSQPDNSKSWRLAGGNPMEFLEVQCLADTDEFVQCYPLPEGCKALRLDLSPSEPQDSDGLAPTSNPRGCPSRQPANPSVPQWPLLKDSQRQDNARISGGFSALMACHQPLLLEVTCYLVQSPKDFCAICQLSPAFTPLLEPFMDRLWAGLYQARWPCFYSCLLHRGAEAWYTLYWQTWRGNSEFQMEIFDREKKRGFCMSAMPALVQYDHAADAYVASYISASEVMPEVIPRAQEHRLRFCPPSARQRLCISWLPLPEVPRKRLCPSYKRQSTYPYKVLEGLQGLEVGKPVELQWKMQLGSPFGWWFCHLEDLCVESNSETATATLIFKHFSPRSQWYRLKVRVGGREVRRSDFGGFTGGLRAVTPEEEALWQCFLPSKVLDV